MDTTKNNTPTTDTLRENRPRPGDGYRRLRSFQLATIIYDATVSFCDRFIDRSSRSHDRMVQAARTGRQNIAASGRTGVADGTTETDLRNAARNSLDELLLDYEDFLRQRNLRAWGGDDSESQAVRNVALEHESPDALGSLAYAAWLEHKDPSVAVNALICLIRQLDGLLVRQAAAPERICLSQSGGSEQPVAARIADREAQNNQSDRTDQSDATDKQFPVCPVCGKIMALRTVRQGRRTGSHFWGCTGYPECKGTMPGKNPA